ncbi:MAG: hypothetical protein N3B21_04895 [Clostridia bacterium]|nr:hypothetical protein [Clostridia bacterium]
MNLFQLDRIQYSIKHNKYFIFEFYKVESVNIKLDLYMNLDCLKEAMSEGEFKKYSILHKMTLGNPNVILFYIIYSEDDSDSKVVYEFKDSCIPEKVQQFNNLQDISRWFVAMNNIDGDSKSKKLGSCTDEDDDESKDGVHRTLTEVAGEDIPYDDSGLDITKKMLGSNTTKGFDFDLFQYIECNNQFIIYEFLKNKTDYVTNYTAHPMRYSWTGGVRDNKQKFVSLWNAAQTFKAKLYLINYSDDCKEGIGVSEVVDLDIDRGFREELKYNLTYEEFIGWMKYMNDYERNIRDYMRDYNSKRKHFTGEFFDDWKGNKKKYN